VKLNYSAPWTWTGWSPYPTWARAPLTGCKRPPNCSAAPTPARVRAELRARTKQRRDYVARLIGGRCTLDQHEPAEEHAREIIAYHTRPDGPSNAPMRSTNSHMDLAVIRARHSDLDEAVRRGLAAFGYVRKTEASLLARAADLGHVLSEPYPGERLADDFHERHLAAHAALRRRTPLTALVETAALAGCH
jgi:hypothetical protein